MKYVLALVMLFGVSTVNAETTVQEDVCVVPAVKWLHNHRPIRKAVDRFMSPTPKNQKKDKQAPTPVPVAK
jgi:hypothetical protein